MPTILVVEDDDILRRDLSRILSREGYGVLTAASLSEAEAALPGAPDLFLLDVWLPDGEGFSLLPVIREMSPAPVLFLTACDDEASVIRGLDLGADDYITKPFRKAELLSRIRANLRRTRAGVLDGPLTAGDLVLDPLTHTVTNAGRAIALRPAEFRLLRLFMENPGLLFSRDRLIERLNADPAEDPLEDNTVSVYISRLRGAIGSRYIETVRGFGYRFRADAGKEDPS